MPTADGRAIMCAYKLCKVGKYHFSYSLTEYLENVRKPKSGRFIRKYNFCIVKYDKV